MTATLSDNAWHEAADAIRTTDTFAKVATRTVSTAGGPVTINGIAKGSGMIAPDMATMLAFIATDANVPASQLRALIEVHCPTTFNAISVDTDTSTSDTLLVFATGAAADATVLDANGPGGVTAEFDQAMHEVMLSLACRSSKMVKESLS